MSLSLHPDRDLNEDIEFLLTHKDSEIFNDWERSFIKSLENQDDKRLSKRDRDVIDRLLKWFETN